LCAMLRKIISCVDINNKISFIYENANCQNDNIVAGGIFSLA